MKKGKKISKNYELNEPLKTIEELVELSENRKSVFVRYRMFPASVILRMQAYYVLQLIKEERLWSIKRIDYEQD